MEGRNRRPHEIQKSPDFEQTVENRLKKGATANMPELDIRPANLTGSRQDLQEMGQVHGISKELTSRNNANRTIKVVYDEDILDTLKTRLN
jgi:hypothetical protein